MNDNLSNGNGNFNGFSSKDILTQLWSKVESIDAKLDQKLGEIDRKVIVLEIQSVQKTGFEIETLNELNNRVSNLEKHEDVIHSSEEALREHRKDYMSSRTFFFGMISSLAIFGNMMATVWLVVSS